MNEQEFEQKLNELVHEINSSNPSASVKKKLAQLAQKSAQKHKKLKQSVNGLQQSLDYLRVSIKYILFDLEATKRENDYLKNELQRRLNDLDDS